MNPSTWPRSRATASTPASRGRATPYGTLSLGVNASGLKLLAENESVKQQSSIVAGTGGYDVRVNGHTHLKGSTIASKADGWRNYFETQTLTHEDVANRDVVSGAGWSVAVNISAGSSGAGAMAGSSVGFARMDTNETFTTRSSVASAVTLTRPDLQASRVAALKASERDPLVAARNQRQRDLNILMINEPPPCDTCAYLSLPPGMDAVGALSAVASPPAAGKTAALSTSAAAQTDRSLPPPEAIDAGNSRYLAWLAAVKATRRDIDALNTRISAVDAKVYQTTASLSTSASGLHQPLLYTFDKTKATQELRDGVAVTAAFGKAAYKAAGDYAGAQYKAAVNACGGNTNCADAENWKDGGPYRAALHMAIGSMSLGTQGALGAGAGQAVLNVMDAAFFARLGIIDLSAVNLLKSAAVTLAGAAVGGTGGAAAAFNADANNRQLHVDQTDALQRRAKQLKGTDGKSAYQWEVELTQQLLRQNDSTYQGLTENARARAELLNIQSVAGISMTAEGTAEFSNPAVNAGQLSLNAPSYLAAGNLPKINPRLDLLTFAYAQVINSPEFLSLSKSVQLQLIRETSTYADSLNASPNSSLSQKSMADATARMAMAWGRLYGALPPDYPLTPAETRASLNTTLAMIGSGIAKAKAKTSDPVVGSAAEKIYTGSRSLEAEFPELRGVNPHYVENASVGVNTNCVSCVNAADARLRGADPSAVASPSGGYKGPNDLLPSIPFGFRPEILSSSQIAAELLAAGNGARGVVLIMQPGGLNHVVNAVNHAGSVYFIDPQIGRVVDIRPDVKLRLGRPS